MIKVLVRKEGEVKFSGEFLTEELADAWIAEQTELKSWGKPERLVAESQLAIEGEDPAAAIQVIIEPTQFGEVKFYRFAPQFTTEKVDITAQKAKEAAIAYGLEAQDTGKKVIAIVTAINDAKFEAGTLTEAQFQDMLANQTLSNIERLLKQGSLKTAKILINSLDNTFFSAAEKESVVEEIDTFFKKYGKL